MLVFLRTPAAVSNADEGIHRFVSHSNQERITSLQGPRPVFSAGPQNTEKCGGVWVRVRRFIIYVMSKCLCKSHFFLFIIDPDLKYTSTSVSNQKYTT
jgi:hypothetical protein